MSSLSDYDQLYHRVGKMSSYGLSSGKHRRRRAEMGVVGQAIVVVGKGWAVVSMRIVVVGKVKVVVG